MILCAKHKYRFLKSYSTLVNINKVTTRLEGKRTINNDTKVKIFMYFLIRIFRGVRELQNMCSVVYVFKKK